MSDQLEGRATGIVREPNVIFRPIPLARTRTLRHRILRPHQTEEDLAGARAHRSVDGTGER